MNFERVRELFLKKDKRFWEVLREASSHTFDSAELLRLSVLRKKGLRALPPETPKESIRIAYLGAVTMYPLHELIEHLLWCQEIQAVSWIGSFDNYVSEIMDSKSPLVDFGPNITVFLPSSQRAIYTGALTDPIHLQQKAVSELVQELKGLCEHVQNNLKCEVILGNFMPKVGYDLGPFRNRSLGSDWAFKRSVNIELGLKIPTTIQLLDLEFLAYRIGGLNARDSRAWYESKQIGSASLLCHLAREVAHLTISLKRPSKKVLALDADNTLWGGVIGDDGIDGIELGETSAVGHSFKDFQKYVRSLKERGILLAICSKNEEQIAKEVFEKHPEMVLRLTDLVSLKINWRPKPENVRQLAEELNVGLDGIVFVDDNPAEIEMMKRSYPEVTSLWLGDCPADYVERIEDCRLFEVANLTKEDLLRTTQYQKINNVKTATFRDHDYLKSLEMKAVIAGLSREDIPRVSQLINKSNQFNLTTRRRTETELVALMNQPEYSVFSIRLKDRFVDHGLISVVIAKKIDNVLEIDTWLMSCRVLQRDVECEALNELLKISQRHSCEEIRGVYIPTPKNNLVREHYDKLGFTWMGGEGRFYSLKTKNFSPKNTQIEREPQAEQMAS